MVPAEGWVPSAFLGDHWEHLVSRPMTRGAALTAASLMILGLTGAVAAATEGPSVARAEATAVRGALAGTPTDSGTVTAVHDGTTSSSTGTPHPQVGVLGNQRLLNAGILAQEATVSFVDGAGESAACAGVAGNGGSLAQVGSSRCLTPGRPVGISVANLDLSGAVVADPATALEPLNALQPVIDELVGPVSQAISQGLAPLGETGLAGTVGAVEARCTAGPTGVTGESHIVDGRLTVAVGGKQVDLIDLPVHPAPNTELFVNLDAVATTVLDAVRTQLDEGLDGQAAPLAAAIDPVQQEIVEGVLAQIGPQLAPLSDNVLKVVLNKQVRTEDRIDVTAMSLELLPAAREMADAPLVAADLGTVGCGPTARVAGVQQTSPAAAPPAAKRPQAKLPKVPSVVAAGVAGERPWYDGLAGPALVVVIAAGVATLGGFRSSTR